MIEIARKININQRSRRSEPPF